MHFGQTALRKYSFEVAKLCLSRAAAAVLPRSELAVPSLMQVVPNSLESPRAKHMHILFSFTSASEPDRLTGKSGENPSRNGSD
jgi:hypothetical protein